MYCPRISLEWEGPLSKKENALNGIRYLIVSRETLYKSKNC